LASRPELAAQLCEFFKQFYRERDAGEIQFQVTLEPYREPGAPQRVARKAPLAADTDDVQDSFLDEFDDVPLIDSAHPAQVLEAQDRGFVKNAAG
jgi:hypothetical protein